MTATPPALDADPRMQRAITEIKALITRRYPGTTFAATDSDDPPGIRVLATVDVDDVDEVVDLVHNVKPTSIPGPRPPPTRGPITRSPELGMHSAPTPRAFSRSSSTFSGTGYRQG